MMGTVYCNLQVLGYGWAGLLRKYVVEPAHMWWPATLVQVSLFRYLLILCLLLDFRFFIFFSFLGSVNVNLMFNILKALVLFFA